MQRAVYLCACGESPDRQTDWYNFRIDRIQDITPLTWNYPDIPQYLQKRYQKASLPTPDEIAIAIDQKAWGFDFYLPSRVMLLRFDRDYDNRYIHNTNRHETFKRINYEKAQNLIIKETPEPETRKLLLNVLANRSSQDAYYQANYRHKDNGITMRLRAWRPRCEVLLPFDLRQSIAKDAAEELKLYQDEF
jgi:CRISPR-associated protein (TIGR03985 family)